MSEAHKNLLEALAAFQAEAPTLRKDGTNPHYGSKYTPLDTIVETIQPLLARHGLVWMAFPAFHDGQPALTYELSHAGTGETKTGTMPLLLQKQDPQGLGSALTYGRRYALTAVLNLVADVDDDANSASRQPSRREPAKSDGQKPGVIDAASLAALRRGYEATGWTPDQLRMNLSAAGVSDVSDVRAAMRGLTMKQAEDLFHAMNTAMDLQAAET